MSNDQPEWAADIERLQAQITALKAVIVALLSELGNRDPAALAKLLSALPRSTPVGVVPLFENQEEIKITLDQIIDSLARVETGPRE